MRKGPYIRPLERVKEEYAAMLRMKRLMAKIQPRTGKPIPDNSVPWIENPKTTEELWEIACKVSELEAKWGPKPLH